MKQLRKFRPNYLLAATFTASLLLTLTWKSSSQHKLTQEIYSPLTGLTDTIPVPGKDTTLKTVIVPADTSLLPGIDSLPAASDTFTLKISKDTLDAPVKYEAEDSAVVLVKEKKIILYGKTKTEYKEIVLTAPTVELDQNKNMLTAMRSKDSLGNIIDVARFQEGDQAFTSDTIFYNFKTQKGLSKNTITQQGEFFVHGKDVKKVSNDITFVKEGLFTTCNLDEPHFAFRANKMKVITDKVAVSGPAHPEFEGVPVPIYIPFGFYPLSKGRHSGFLPPQYTNNAEYGLGLEGLGYYKVLSAYWDVRVQGNIYSYGGWSANIQPQYRKRYRYSGSFNISVQSTKLNFKGDPDFSKTKSFFVSWGHSVDSRARPGTTFSANVNAGSTKYNQYVPNDPRRNFQNQLGSSISYSKTWKDKPYNLTLAANHSQNNATRLINMSLPNAGFTMSTIYPFERKEIIGSKKWYENLGIGYNGNFRNQFSFYDTAFNFKDLIDTLQWGAQHSFPISLSLPPILGGAIILSPGVSYSQVWIAQKFDRTWNPALQKVDTNITKGIFMDQQVSFSLGLNTALFGTYQFKNERAIRHVIRPSISFNYAPTLSKKYYDSLQYNVNGDKILYSKLQGGLYSGFGNVTNGGIGFGIDNNLEMKYRSKKDTTDEFKKLRLIENFGFRGGYNFLAPDRKLSHISLYLSNNLFGKINLNASANMSPYLRNRFGQDSAVYIWKGPGGFKPGRITGGSLSLSTSFQSKPKDQEKEEQRQKQLEQQLATPELIADQQRLLDYMRQNPAEFVNFNIPWQVNLSLSVNFHERLKPDYSGFETEFNSNLNFSGSFNLTPKWNFNSSGYYDFDTKKLQTFQLGISRDMHCWQMSINVAFGLYRFYNISISPKASILQDLRINRTKYFTDF